VLHIFEKEYCPFGLIRYGVAPDHISIKKTENTLSSISSYPYFGYSGNTTVDGSFLNRLREQYSGIIFATGAQEDNIPAWMVGKG
jgi:adrenodoxin-NADP+ reductase